MHRDDPEAGAGHGAGGDGVLPELKARFDAAYGTRVSPWTAERHRELIHRSARRPEAARRLTLDVRQLGALPHAQRLGRVAAAAAAAVALLALSHAVPWLGSLHGQGSGAPVASPMGDMYAWRALSEANARLTQADAAAGERPDRVPGLLEGALGALERAEQLGGRDTEHLAQQARQQARARALELAEGLEGDARQRTQTVAQRFAAEPGPGDDAGRSPRRRTPGQSSVEVVVEPEPDEGTAEAEDSDATLAAADDPPEQEPDGDSPSIGSGSRSGTAPRPDQAAEQDDRDDQDDQGSACDAPAGAPGAEDGDAADTDDTGDSEGGDADVDDADADADGAEMDGGESEPWEEQGADVDDAATADTDTEEPGAVAAEEIDAADAVDDESDCDGPDETGDRAQTEGGTEGTDGADADTAGDDERSAEADGSGDEHPDGGEQDDEGAAAEGGEDDPPA